MRSQLEKAIEQSRSLRLADPRIEQMGAAGRFMAALLLEDEDRVREHLTHVGRTDDRQQRYMSASMIGSSAPHLASSWYDRVISIWEELAADKPRYFQIAWVAVRLDAPEHALLVAARAAKRFRDDPTFSAEHDFMKGLLIND